VGELSRLETTIKGLEAEGHADMLEGTFDKINDELGPEWRTLTMKTYLCTECDNVGIWGWGSGVRISKNRKRTLTGHPRFFMANRLLLCSAHLALHLAL